MLDSYPTPPRGLVEAATFPLIEAIHGRRSRRFAKGATIPNGPLAFTSRQAPEPLDPLEQMLLISTVAGNTGWVKLFAHHPGYAAKLPNYTTAAGGRSFPSSAGFNTTEFFFTDDTGVYFLPTRDMTPVAVERRNRPRRLARGAPGADRQARRRPAEHPGRDAVHGGAQHLVRQRARLDADLAGRGRGAARDPAAALPRAERHRHLRRRQRPADPRAGAVRPPAEPGGRLSDDLPRAGRDDRRVDRDWARPAMPAR